MKKVIFFLSIFSLFFVGAKDANGMGLLKGVPPNEASRAGADGYLPRPKCAPFCDSCWGAMGNLWERGESSAVNMRLIQAARDNDISNLNDALATGADVNFQEASSGKTAFHWFAKWGNLNAIRILIDRGADPFVFDCFGNTALHVVADELHFELALFIENCLGLNHVERIKMLLVQKPGYRFADCASSVRSGGYRSDEAYPLSGSPESITSISSSEESLADSFDYRAFAALLKKDRFALIKLLNTGGIDINSQSPIFGITLLMLASQMGWLEGVDILIRRCALFFIVQNYEKSPLHIAARFGHNHIIRYLVRTNKNLPSDFKKIDQGGIKTPLALALENGHFDTAALLLAFGFEFDCCAKSYCCNSIRSFAENADSLCAFLKKHEPAYAASQGFF